MNMSQYNSGTYFNKGQEGKLYNHINCTKCVKIFNMGYIGFGKIDNRWKDLSKKNLAPKLYGFVKVNDGQHAGQYYILMEKLNGDSYGESSNIQKIDKATKLIRDTINNKIVIDNPIIQEIFIMDCCAKWTDLSPGYHSEPEWNSCENQLNWII